MEMVQGKTIPQLVMQTVNIGLELVHINIRPTSFLVGLSPFNQAMEPWVLFFFLTSFKLVGKLMKHQRPLDCNANRLVLAIERVSIVFARHTILTARSILEQKRLECIWLCCCVVVLCMNLKIEAVIYFFYLYQQETKVWNPLHEDNKDINIKTDI